MLEKFEQNIRLKLDNDGTKSNKVKERFNYVLFENPPMILVCMWKKN